MNDTFETLSEFKQKTLISEGLLRKTLDTLPVGITILNSEGMIIYANIHAEKILGLKKDIITQLNYNSPEWKIVGVDEEEFTEDKLPFFRVKITKKPVIDICHAIQWPSGKKVILSINAEPIFDVNGIFEGAVTSIQDITEKRKFELMLDENNQNLKQSETKYRMIFESSGTANSIFDREYRLIMQNNVSAKELKRPVEESIGKTVNEIFGEEKGEIVKKRLTRIFETGISETFVTEFDLPEGQKYFKSIYQPIFNKNREVESIQIISSDITELKTTEKKLILSERRLREVVDNSPFGVHMYELLPDNNLVFKGFNLSANQILGVDCIQFVGKSIEEAFPGLINTEIPEKYRNVALTGKNYTTDQIIYDLDKIHGAFEIHAFQNSQNHMTVFFIDITERKKIEKELEHYREHLETLVKQRTDSLDKSRKAAMSLMQDANIEKKRAEETLKALKESESRYRLISKNTADVIWLYDLDKDNFIYVSPSVERLSGFSIDEVLSKTISDFFTPESYQRFRMNISNRIEKFLNADKSSETFGERLDQINKKGKIVHTEVVSTLLYGENGSISQILGVSRDINTRTKIEKELQEYRDHLKTLVYERTAKLQLEIVEREKVEEQLRASIKEKETLLKELYHRTKNNMQVICSMISLEASYSKNEQTIKIVKEMESKIRSMSLVHEKLYQSKNLSNINLKEYTKELTQLILKSHADSSKYISTLFEIDDINVLIDTAIPFGLILNELITNTLKYAFPNKTHGKINIILKIKTNGEIEFIFSDNGIGVPADFDFRAQNSLGLQSIFAIAENQLQGDIHFEIKNGIKCIIKFNDQLYFQRV